MARPTVPHCKDCPWLRDKRCRFDVRGIWFCARSERFINGQEVRTSPVWCLRRYGFHR